MARPKFKSDLDWIPCKSEEPEYTASCGEYSFHLTHAERAKTGFRLSSVLTWVMYGFETIIPPDTYQATIRAAEKQIKEWLADEYPQKDESTQKKAKDKWTKLGANTWFLRQTPNKVRVMLSPSSEFEHKYNLFVGTVSHPLFADSLEEARKKAEEVYQEYIPEE